MNLSVQVDKAKNQKKSFVLKEDCIRIKEKNLCVEEEKQIVNWIKSDSFVASEDVHQDNGKLQNNICYLSTILLEESYVWVIGSNLYHNKEDSSRSSTIDLQFSFCGELHLPILR